jgi:hypothetical protein
MPRRSDAVSYSLLLTAGGVLALCGYLWCRDMPPSEGSFELIEPIRTIDGVYSRSEFDSEFLVRNTGRTVIRVIGNEFS